jgi:hypothetical protein
LAINLKKVCDASKGAIFNPSPNDPLSGPCLCDGVTCQPVDLSTSGTLLFLTAKIRLQTFSNNFGTGTTPQKCNQSGTRVYSPMQNSSAVGHLPDPVGSPVPIVVPGCIAPPPSFDMSDVINASSKYYIQSTVASDTNTNYVFVTGLNGTPLNNPGLDSLLPANYNYTRRFLKTHENSLPPMVDLTGDLTLSIG